MDISCAHGGTSVPRERESRWCWVLVVVVVVAVVLVVVLVVLVLLLSMLSLLSLLSLLLLHCLLPVSCVSARMHGHFCPVACYALSSIS